MLNILIYFYKKSFISIFVFHSLSILDLFQDFTENEQDSPKKTIVEKFVLKIQSRIYIIDFAISILKFRFKYSKSQRTIIVNFRIYCFVLQCPNIGYNGLWLGEVGDE